MSEVIDLNSKRPPVVYTVTIVHHYDDTLEIRVEDVAGDLRSREAVMSAFRRISGADEEIENLQIDLRHAINCDNEYVKQIDRQNAVLREENARLREALKPFAARLDDLEKMKASKYACATPVEIEHLRTARAAIQDGGKDA